MKHDERQVVVFEVGDDLFAIDILQVKEIARYQKIRRIPKAPAFLDGVIDLRGEEIVPVIDLHSRLEAERRVPPEESRIVVAKVDGIPVGLLVDRVRDVLTIPMEAIEAPPAVGAAPSFLEGIIRRDSDIVLLLDVSRMLTADEKLHMEELRRALQQGGGRERSKGRGREGKRKDKGASS